MKGEKQNLIFPSVKKYFHSCAFTLTLEYELLETLLNIPVVLIKVWNVANKQMNEMYMYNNYNEFIVSDNHELISSSFKIRNISFCCELGTTSYKRSLIVYSLPPYFSANIAHYKLYCAETDVFYTNTSALDTVNKVEHWNEYSIEIWSCINESSLSAISCSVEI